MHATGYILYLLKTSENQRFSYVFLEYRNGTLVQNGLISCVSIFQQTIYIQNDSWGSGKLLEYKYTQFKNFISRDIEYKLVSFLQKSVVSADPWKFGAFVTCCHYQMQPCDMLSTSEQPNVCVITS